MRSFLRSHPLGVGLGAATLLAGVAWLAFGFFGVHTLVVDDVVDEPPPTFASQPVVASDPADDGADAPGSTGEVTERAADDEAVGVDAAADPTTTAPQIVLERRGEFSGLGRYDAEGVATVLGDGSGQRFLRFEQFATDNGPDLNVYLVNSSVEGTTDVIDLGDLSGNIGDQNYEIPPEVDLDVYDTVVIWCVRFSAPFGEALLTAV